MASRQTDEQLGRKYFSEVQDADLRLLIVEDLKSVGVPDSYFQAVHLAQNAFALKKWVKNFFRLEQNVIIFGSAGFGKTQIIEQAASELGYDTITDTASIKLPEDYGGIPMAGYVDEPEDIIRLKIARDIKKEKLDEAVEAEFENISKTQTFSNTFLAKKEIRADLEPNITVTDEEIAERLNAMPENDPRRRRLVQSISAPDWIFKIQDKFLRTGKITVIFFDELNQAMYQTLNTLFQFVQKKRFGDRNEYSLADAVIFAAAGNFQRENPSVSQIPAPLLDRFGNIICYEGDWPSSIYWNKQSYLDQASRYPHLAKLLNDSSVSDMAWQETFQTPRAMEEAIRLWAKLEKISQTQGPDALADYDDLDSVRIPARNKTTLATAVMRFLADIGAPAFVKMRDQGAPNAANPVLFRKQATAFTRLWDDFMSGKRVTIPGGTAVTNKDMDSVTFFKAMFKSLPLLTQEVLANALDHTTSKSALDTLREAGISQNDLPKI